MSISLSDINSSLLVFLGLVVIVTISGCQSTSIKGGRTGELSYSDPAALIAAAERAGQTKQGATLRLRAVEILIAAKDFQIAHSYLETLNGDLLPRTERKNITRAQIAIALHRADVEHAVNLLSSLQVNDGPDYMLAARVCAATKDHTCAADGWIQASLIYGSNHEILPEDIHDTIWQHLSSARGGPALYSHPHHHAWWLLQKQIREAGTITAQKAVWLSWQQANPNHPASIRPPRVLQKLDGYHTPTMAVLLPLTGSLSAAGRAVRDGLVAAYMEETLSTRAPIQFYDTAAQDLAQIWESVLNSDADVAIGPLIKSTVQKFADLTTHDPLPRLSLNYLAENDPNEAGLFQLGISIEDEARSLATHMLFAGFERIMLLHSEAPWSRRARHAFESQWPYPITTGEFANVRELTKAVGSAMLTEDSGQRKTEIQRIMGKKIEFLPRARKDLDAIITLTTNVESRALVPALRFHFGDHLPIYTTSQAVRKGDAETLTGFNLTEIPLLTDPKYKALTEVFNVADSNFVELYALGYDAFRLGTWLPVLAPDSRLSIPGASGHLWLDGKGVFRRELDLATFGK